MNQPNEVPTPAPKKLIVKFGKPLGVGTGIPQPASAPPIISPPTQIALPTVISSATPKLGRLIIKTSAPVVQPLPILVEETPLEAVNPLRNRRGEIIDPEGRARKRELALDVETIPVSKRRKEMELEDESGGMRGMGEGRRKNWVPMKKMLNNALKKLIDLDGYKFFYSPVSEKDAPGYFSIIKKPMDFSTMRKKLTDDKYTYWSLFVEDFELICQNCITFNQPNSIYWNEAKTLLLEGKKYLKVQATKINPELLTPPSSYDELPPSSSAPPSDTTPNRPQPTTTTIKTSLESPLHSLAPPPPVHLAKLPAGTLAKPFEIKEHLVAKRTPQQQMINRSTEWPPYVSQPSIRSHWAHSIPTFIHHTRGYPSSQYHPHIHSQPSSHEDTLFFSELVSSPPSLRTPQEAYYLKQFREASRSKPTTEHKNMIQSLPEAGFERFNAMLSILSTAPESLDPSSFASLTAASNAMNVDTTSVATKKDLLTANANDLVELNALRTGLASSHIDLSFLEKLFHYDSKADPLQSFQTASVGGMLARAAILIPSLNASLCQRSATAPPSVEEADKMAELSANLVLLSEQLPKHTIDTSKAVLDPIRTAVELGLSSVPDTTPVILNNASVKFEGP
jgi:hypothetical protein